MRDPDTNRELPPPQSFALQLAEMNEGETNAELSETLQQLSLECAAIAAASMRTVKAAISVTFALSVDEKGAASIVPDIRTKRPARSRGTARFYVDPTKGHLVRNDPKQPPLPFTEIQGGRAEPREVAGGRIIKG